MLFTFVHYKVLFDGRVLVVLYYMTFWFVCWDSRSGTTVERYCMSAHGISKRNYGKFVGSCFHLGFFVNLW